MSIFKNPIKKLIGGYFLDKTSININQVRCKEILEVALIRKAKQIVLGFYKLDLHDIGDKDHEICFIFLYNYILKFLIQFV